MWQTYLKYLTDYLFFFFFFLLFIAKEQTNVAVPRGRKGIVFQRPVNHDGDIRRSPWGAHVQCVKGTLLLKQNLQMEMFARFLRLGAYVRLLCRGSTLTLPWPWPWPCLLLLRNAVTGDRGRDCGHALAFPFCDYCLFPLSDGLKNTGAGTKLVALASVAAECVTLTGTCMRFWDWEWNSQKASVVLSNKESV